MRERLNRADSKSVVLIFSTEGSNPSLSVGYHVFFGRDDRAAEGARLESVCTLTGYRGFESLSLRISPLALMAGICAIGDRPNPSGPEGSSGKWLTDEQQYSRPELRGFF